jgi:hypothetical protein
MLQAALLLASCLSVTLAAEAGRAEQTVLYGELGKAFNDACAYLAIGSPGEAGRVPTDDSVSLYATPYGPIPVKGMARHATLAAREWIDRIVATDMRPPATVEFKAYHKTFRAELNDWDGYDTVVTAYQLGETSIRVSQTIWLFAMTIEGPQTKFDLGGADPSSLADEGAALLKKFIQSQGGLDLDLPQRHTKCVTCCHRVPPPSPTQGSGARPATSQEARDYIERERATLAAAGPPDFWRVVGWWADGQRFGILCQHVRCGLSSVPGDDPVLNRTWFFGIPRSEQRLQKMAAEYRASTKPGSRQ